VAIGFWHGAGWTFVVFGLMHGTYLSVNEYWRMYRRRARKTAPPGPWDMAGYHVLTLLCVIAANVVFRAESMGSAVAIWAGMLRLGEVGQIAQVLPATAAELLAEPALFVAVCAALVALCPNTQQIMGRYTPVLNWDKWRVVAPAALAFQWRPTLPWAVVTGLVLFGAVAFVSRGQTEFIYFNF